MVRGYWNVLTVGETNGGFAGSLDGQKFFILGKRGGKEVAAIF